MAKPLFYVCWLAVVSVLTTGCTVYTEKQSEALSQAVYLADDSFEVGRFDVTDSSLDQAIKIVKPPKKRQKIYSVARSTQNEVKRETDVFSPEPQTNKGRIVIVPERFKNQEIVVVNSDEYKTLLSDKKIFEQLKTDYKNLQTLKTTVDEELARQHINVNQMVIDLNNMQKQIIKKNLLILKLYCVIAGLGLLLGGGIYLRMKGIL